MSSYYTAAQLEAMRKEKIRKELADSIQRLSIQLQEKHENSVHISNSGNVEISVFVTDDTTSGSGENLSVAKESLTQSANIERTQQDGLDFSGLLISKHRVSKLEEELNSWIERIGERPIIIQSDEDARKRLKQELQRILNQSVDIEDKIRSIKMRVMSYLQGKQVLTVDEINKIRDRYYEYVALCQFLDLTPTETTPYRVEQEIVRMATVVEKRKQTEYIMQVIQSIMEKMGCQVKEDAILDHTMGQVFSVEGHPLCDVFVGNDGSGIMFEPIGRSRGGSLEKKRQIEASANHVCSLYAELEQQAAEMGVILSRVYLDPANVDTMCIQEDVSAQKSEKKQRKGSVQKLKAMETGE